MGVLTDCYGVVDFEAAEHLVDVSGMEKTVSSHHHLEGLWLHDTHLHFRHCLPSKITFDTVCTIR